MLMHENDVLCYVKLILMMYYGIVILLYSRLKQFEIQEIKSLNFMTDFLKIYTFQWNWGLWGGMQSFTVQAQGSCQSVPQRMSSMRCRQWIYWFLNDDRLFW